MKYKEKSPELFVADEDIVKAARCDVEFLKKQAPATTRGRTRFCAHKSTDESIHEMLIVLMRGTYIRPHKHLAKVESFHIIEGMVDVVIFDDAGEISEIVRMGDYASGRNFYYRLSISAYHSLVIRTEQLVIHETTNGPFHRDDMILAPWAPSEENAAAARKYMKMLSELTATPV